MKHFPEGQLISSKKKITDANFFKAQWIKKITTRKSLNEQGIFLQSIPVCSKYPG